MKKDAFDLIRNEIARVKSDERWSYPPAPWQTNAPLALVQVEMKSRVAALEWLRDALLNGSNGAREAQNGPRRRGSFCSLGAIVR